MVVLTGDMDKKVAVQKYTETSDAIGGFIETWATENLVWAKITPLSGKERDDADRTHSTTSHRITMRFYSPGIVPRDRILWDSREFYITAVINPGERGCFTVLDVMEKI